MSIPKAVRDHMATIGAKGGRRTTVAQATARAANGRKGGRPPGPGWSKKTPKTPGRYELKDDKGTRFAWIVAHAGAPSVLLCPTREGHRHPIESIPASAWRGPLVESIRI